MDKHKEIWIREESFLEKVKGESGIDKEELYSKIEKLTKWRNSELDSVKYLDPDSAESLRLALSETNVKIFLKKAKYKTYDKFLQSPYFYRVGTDRGPIYISKHFPNLKNNIVSFTSPAAQLRYGELNNTIKVVQTNFSITDKDEIEIQNSKLLKVSHKSSDSNFTYDGKISVLFFPKSPVRDIEVKKDNLLIEKNDISIEEDKKKVEKPVFNPTVVGVEEEKKYVLGEIIEQMRKEQDEIMRAPITGVTLVSGSAGSGKTNIAFHRIVYLIREFGVRKAESFFSSIINTFTKETEGVFHEYNIAVFCFNVALRKYLGNLSEELGISKIKIFSIDIWVWDKLVEYSDFKKSDIHYDEKSEDTISKTRKEQVCKIEAFVKNKMDDLTREIKISEKEGIRETLGELLSLGDSVKNISSLFRRIRSVLDKYKKNQLDSYYEIDSKEKIKKFIKTETFNIVKRHFFTENSFEKDFNKPKFRCYDLLSDYFDFINDKDSSKRVKENHIVYISDAIILCHIMFNLTEGGGLEFFSKYDHVVIDEVQDFFPLQIVLLKRLSKNSMTIVGDTTQGIFSQGIKSWGEIGIPIDYKYELKLSHRSTLENILFANEIVSANNKTLATTVAKRGPKPLILTSSDFNEVKEKLVILIKEIKRVSPKDSISIVELDTDNYNILDELFNTFEYNNIESYIPWKGSWEFGTKVSITTYRQIKGLEFDHVFILGLNKFETLDDIKNKENVLYTVITRAQKKIYILCEKELPKILKIVDRDLYDLE